MGARKDLTEKQLAYVVWLSTPDGQKNPKTVTEFCAVVGIDQSTVWRWSKDPRIMDATRFIVLQNAGDPKRVTQVLDVLFQKAVDGDLKAAEAWIKAVGITNQFQRGNSILDALDEGDIQITDLSDEELERLRQEAAAQAAETVTVNRAKEALAHRGVTD
jgi:hypothetical protein